MHMAIAFSILRRQIRWTGLVIAFAVGGASGALAAGLDVKFDFARVVEFQDTTPAERAELYPHERLVTMRLPISVRFQGLAEGEVEHLDIEIDGSPSGLSIQGFSPATQLTSEAVAVETITKRSKERSLGATLGAAIPVPIGPVVAEAGPSISGGMSSADEATEKIKRLPPKRPIVVSGTFAEGRAVFFKLKPSTQTSLEGVHEIVVTFAAPAEWRGGSVRITCVARGNKSVWWTTQPTVFGQVDTALQLYPAGNLRLREAAMRRSEDVRSSKAASAWGLGDLFVRGS
jgi:hypothetical protein